MSKNRRHRRTNFEESAFKNNAAFNYYVDRLTELAQSLFKWEDLPETVPDWFIERILFDEGHIVFFRDEDLGFLALPAALGPGENAYGVPMLRDITAVNGYHATRTENDSVIIYNNRLHLPDIGRVRMYAGRLAELDRVIDVNARAQKTPVLVQGTEKQRLSLLNLYKEYDGNAPVIFGDKNLDLNSIRSISTGAPYVADRIYELKTKIWNEALTYLGISNLTINKKERLITDEVQRSQGGTLASRYSRLLARQKAAEEINKMFSLDIRVSFRDSDETEDPEDIAPVPDETEEEGGGEDE